jgi:hypothetical protein
MEFDFYKNFQPLCGFRTGVSWLGKDEVSRRGAEAQRSSVVGGIVLAPQSNIEMR